MFVEECSWSCCGGSSVSSLEELLSEVRGEVGGEVGGEVVAVIMVLLSREIVIMFGPEEGGTLMVLSLSFFGRPPWFFFRFFGRPFFMEKKEVIFGVLVSFRGVADEGDMP